MGIFFIMIAMIAGCGTAGNYDRNGKISFTNGDYEKAAASFAAAVKANPNRADYYIDYGMSLIALGKYDEALAQFDLAYVDKDMLIIRENNKRALRGKGIAYYHMLQYDKAIKVFKSALKIDELTDLDMDILYYMADSLYTTGSYKEAAVSYSSILAKDKKAAIAYSKRALCYQKLGEYDKSSADYDSAISLEPDNYEYYFGKYYLMAENKNEAGALEVLKKAEAIKAATSEDQYNLAKLHYFEGDYDTALSELSEGYTNGFVEAYYYIGEIYRIQKDYAKAIYYYQAYIDGKTVTSPNVYNQIAVCMLKKDQGKDALEYLEQGLAYNDAGTMQVLKKNEIIIYEKMGKYKDAKQKLEEYLKNYPKDSLAAREAEFIASRVDAAVTIVNSNE